MKQFVFWALWIGTAIVAYVNGGRLAYQVFYILSIIFTLAFFFMLGVTLLIKLEFGVEKGYVVSGEKAVIIARLRNAFILPVPALILNFSSHRNVYWPRQAAVSVFPFRTKTLRGKATFAYRGVYTVGVASWRAGDYFGIFSAGRRVGKYTEIKVLPKIVTMAEYPPLPPHEIDDNVKSVSGTELFGARPYVSSDGMRAIHWKLSAKSDDQLFVKEFNSTKRPPVWVVTDINSIDGDEPEAMEDKLLETSLSLTRHLLDAFPVQTAVFSDVAVTKPLKTNVDFQEYYQWIGLAEFCGDGFARMLVNADFGEVGIMWVVTANPNIVEQLGSLLAQDWDVRWLLVSCGDAAAQLEKTANLGIPSQKIALDGGVADASWML